MKKSNSFVRLTIIAAVFVIATSCGQGNRKNAIDHKLLSSELVGILTEDQKLRQTFSSVEEKYGIQSKEKKELVKAIKTQDSINTVKVTSILDNYGWLGIDEVGENGNNSLFLVIQHSGLETQEKYLPMMRGAVKSGKALGSDLAFLEDRVALRQGGKQIYGSQLYRNNETGKFYFAPIADELNVNKRRKEVGLGSIEDRAREFGFEYEVDAK